MCTISTQCDDLDVNAFLAYYDAYICTLAKRSIYKLYGRMASDKQDMEIDELAQRVRIKLWQALQKRHIENPQAYIHCIVHNESISMLRQQRQPDSFKLTQKGEVYQGQLIVEMH